MIERSQRPANYETPLDVFTTRITPLQRFFVRNHFDLPTWLDPKAWRLQIDGLVEEPLSLGLGDLEQMPQTTVEAVLQCSGNGRALFEPRMPGVQWKKGAFGNARWTGVRLKDVLARARPKTAARFVESQGYERPVIAKSPSFIRCIPVDKALHEDTLLALRMNDQPLSLAHGAPVRLIVPGWVGDDWIKFVQRLTFLPEESKAFYYATAYRFPTEPGAPGAPIPPEKMGPMTTMVVKSIIGSPLWGGTLQAGPQKVRGVAFSGGHGIAKVDVSVDGGKTWQAANLETGGAYGFTVFEHSFIAAPGPCTILSCAIDEKGNRQPERPLWNPSGYLHNAIDRVEVPVMA